MWQRTIEKKIVKTIKQNWKKERKEKQVVKVIRSLTWIEKTIWKELNEQQWVDFILTWSTNVITTIGPRDFITIFRLECELTHLDVIRGWTMVGQ